MKVWRPISTAPKDGQDLLLFVPSHELTGSQIVIGWYEADIAETPGVVERGWRSLQIMDYDDYASFKPTHWLRLPEPPL